MAGLLPEGPKAPPKGLERRFWGHSDIGDGSLTPRIKEKSILSPAERGLEHSVLLEQAVASFSGLAS